MAKILLKLDEPSKIITENPDIEEEFMYAVVVDNIKDLDEEGTRMIIYGTKEDFEKGNGCASFPTDCMMDNWFEYTAHFIN
jgi:hypothetical protein